MFIMVAMSVLVFLATHALPSNAAAVLGQYSTPETQAALEHSSVSTCRSGAVLALGEPYAAGTWAVVRDGRPVAPILWDAFGAPPFGQSSSMAVVSTLGLALG